MGFRSHLLEFPADRPRRGVLERGGCSAPEEFLLGFQGMSGTWSLTCGSGTPQLIPILPSERVFHEKSPLPDPHPMLQVLPGCSGAHSWSFFHPSLPDPASGSSLCLPEALECSGIPESIGDGRREPTELLVSARNADPD